MAVSSFDELLAHKWHNMQCVPYGTPPANVAIECIDCNEVMIDFDKDSEEDSMLDPDRMQPPHKVGCILPDDHKGFCS